MILHKIKDTEERPVVIELGEIVLQDAPEFFLSPSTDLGTPHKIHSRTWYERSDELLY